MALASDKIPIFKSREQLEAYVTRGVYPVGDQGREENMQGNRNGRLEKQSQKDKYNQAIRQNIVDVPSYNRSKRLAEQEREQKIVKDIHEGIRKTSVMTSSLTMDNNSGGGSNIPLSPGEIEMIRKKENAARRALRIKQVRDQEKLYAARLVRLRQQQVATKHAKVVAKKRQAWEEERDRDMDDLQSRYKKQVTSIGAAHKQASSLVGIQADEARKSLRVWELSNSVNEKRHSKAVVTKKNADSEHKRKLHEARQRTETRYNEQQVQRFKAHQYKAAIDEAKNRRKESHTVEVNYDNTDVVREIIAPVQSQGPGVIDFSKTHFHHAVTRHRAAAGPQVSVEKAQVDVVVKSGPASESRSELQVGIDRGSMVSGVEGALDARRRQIEREAKKEADAALSRERARQRARVAAEKIRMEKEYRTITEQLKVLDMSNRAARLKAFQLTQRQQAGNTLGTKPVAPEDIDAAAQDSFEREFIDGKPSFDMDDSNAEINASSDMNIKIKNVVNVPEGPAKVDVVDVMEVRTVLPAVDKDISEKNALNTGSAVDEAISKPSGIEAADEDVEDNGNADGNTKLVKKIHISRTGSVEVSVERSGDKNESSAGPTRTMMQISQGLSKIAGELNDAGTVSAPETAKSDPDEFYQSYLQKYTKDTEATNVKISDARQQMRRDRALAAKKKKMKAADTAKDDIFLFQVGKKGKVIDATEVASSNKADGSAGSEDALEKKAAAAAAVAAYHQLQVDEEEEAAMIGVNNFSTDSIGMDFQSGGDENTAQLLKEAEIALQEAESMTIGDEGTESSKFNVGPDLQTMLQDDEDDKKFKSALDEANDVLRELDEMTQGEVTRELQVYEDTKATATVDVPRATSLIDGLEETNNNFETTADVKSGKWKTEEEEVAEKLEAERIKRAKKGMVWEVKVGDGSGATASSKVSSLAARLKRGDKPKVAKEEARKRSKKVAVKQIKERR